MAVISGMAASFMWIQIGLAQDAGTAVGEEASTAEVYIAVILSIISLANTVFPIYLAQKAKMTGQAPNETDLRIQQQLVTLQEKAQNAAGAIANLTDFVGNKVAPEAYQQIAEGSLPYIKAKEVTKKVGEVEEDVKQGEQLLKEIQSKVE